MSEFDNDHLCTLRAALLDHPIYTHIASTADLRRFMEDHVFAVWDFMSLLKSLQRSLTCVQVPWVPQGFTGSRRLIHSLVAPEHAEHPFQHGPGRRRRHPDCRAERRECASRQRRRKLRSVSPGGRPPEMTGARACAPCARGCQAGPDSRLGSPRHGGLMTPDGRMRAALRPKSCAASRAMMAVAPPPGTGRPSAVSRTG